MNGRGIASVPQGRDIFPLLSVRENLETGFGLLPRHEQKVSDEIFELFPILAKMQRRQGSDFSGGQQQLAIARALVIRPRLLPPVCFPVQEYPVHVTTALRRMRRQVSLYLLDQQLDAPWSDGLRASLP